jgi:hypothetical protein
MSGQRDRERRLVVEHPSAMLTSGPTERIPSMNEILPFSELPAAVASYLSTPKERLSGEVEQLFTDDAVVHDDGRTHIGIDAIASWTDQAASAFTFTRTVIGAIVRPHASIVRVVVEGDFPGSPVELHHHFSLTNDRIAAMTICT